MESGDGTAERAPGEFDDPYRVEALGRLVAGVAHELNNPLTAILTFADQLRADATSTVDRLALDTIYSQAMRSRAIVADLLAFVRHSPGRALVPVRTSSVIDRSVTALRPHLQLLGIELKADLTDDGAWVDADVTALEQVVTNLLLNAAYAAGGGGHVRASSRSTASDALILVDDDGAGLDPVALPHLFEPFFTTKPVGQGTGLGLFVAMGIAKRHGGDILAENRTGAGERGARFTVRLPRVTAPSPVSVRPRATAADAPSSSGARRRILIVDDEEAIRLSLRRYLTRRGWAVDEAADGRAALAAIRGQGAEPFAMVLCDLRMPGMGGAELHAVLEAEDPAMLRRLVLVSGDLISAEATGLLQATRCRVLEKPFELSQLAEIADELVDS